MSNDMRQDLGGIGLYTGDPTKAVLECGECGASELNVVLPLANNPTNRLELECQDCGERFVMPDGDAVAERAKAEIAERRRKEHEAAIEWRNRQAYEDKA